MKKTLDFHKKNLLQLYYVNEGTVPISVETVLFCERSMQIYNSQVIALFFHCLLFQKIGNNYYVMNLSEH